MALKFDIKSTQDCGTLKYTNCSTYCSPDNYDTNFLIASVSPKIIFLGDQIQLTTDILTFFQLDTVEWEVNGGSTITSTSLPTNTGLIQFTQILPGLVAGVNTIVMTVTDVQNNVSVLTFKIKVSVDSGQFTLVWLAIPELSITTGNTLEVGFNDASVLTNTAIDTNTIDFDPDGSSSLNTVQNFTYAGEDVYILSYEFEEDTDNELVSLTAVIGIGEVDTDCNNQLTTTDISSVSLAATSPSNVSYVADITNLFLLNNFDVTTSMLGINSDTFTSGIWTFQTIVTKVSNTGTFIFAQTIKVVLFCKEQCAFNSYVATYAEEELDCCSSCKEEKEKKIILMSTYIDAIKNASACGELNKITKFINLLQRLLSNKNCSC